MLQCRSVSHEHVPLNQRELLSFSPSEQSAWLSSLDEVEAILLVTCNRTELYANLPQETHMNDLWAHLLCTKCLDPLQFASQTLHLNGFEASHHLFQVASSLKSLVLGEAQILGQVTHALDQSLELDTCGHMLSVVFRAAIHAAKRVHHETPIGQGQISVSALGINQIEQVLGDLSTQKILVIGAGEMGQAILKGLDRRKLKHITLISRTYQRACELAEQWSIQARPLTDLKELLLEADIVFSTSNAPFPILVRADLEPIMAQRGKRDLYLVDIAVPRDIDPSASQLEGIHLYNLDEFEQAVQQNRQQRADLIPEVETILQAELTRLWQTLDGQSVVPTIRRLRNHVEQIRQMEFDRICNRLSDDNEQFRELLEEFSHRFMNKVLHQPTHNLKTKASQGAGALYSSVATDLFGLED